MNLMKEHMHVVFAMLPFVASSLNETILVLLVKVSISSFNVMYACSIENLNLHM